MNLETFDRSVLSARENAILDGAIEGMTDMQISQRLDISQSTVNSYWVRIRGKLGQLSRTELVALALKSLARTEMDVAQAELDALRTEARDHARMSEDFARSEVYRAALDAMPEAMLICCHEGLIRFANSRLEAMFGYELGELTDCPIAELVPRTVREGETRMLLAYMKAPYPLCLGLGHVVYGQRKNGTQFRIVMLLDGRPTSHGPVASCIVRDFTSEIDVRRAHTSTWI